MNPLPGGGVGGNMQNLERISGEHGPSEVHPWTLDDLVKLLDSQ